MCWKVKKMCVCVCACIYACVRACVCVCVCVNECFFFSFFLKHTCIKELETVYACFNNNNVHLSCAHQHPWAEMWKTDNSFLLTIAEEGRLWDSSFLLTIAEEGRLWDNSSLLTIAEEGRLWDNSFLLTIAEEGRLWDIPKMDPQFSLSKPQGMLHFVTGPPWSRTVVCIQRHCSIMMNSWFMWWNGSRGSLFPRKWFQNLFILKTFLRCSYF